VEVRRRPIKDLDGQIRQGNENLVLLPHDRLAGVVATIRGWEQERGHLVGGLEALERGTDLADAEAETAAAEAALWRLREGLENDDATPAATSLREMVSKGELFWEHKPRGAHTVSVFCRGLVSLRADEQVSGLVASATAAVTTGCTRPVG